MITRRRFKLRNWKSSGTPPLEWTAALGKVAVNERMSHRMVNKGQKYMHTWNRNISTIITEKTRCEEIHCWCLFYVRTRVSKPHGLLYQSFSDSVFMWVVGRVVFLNLRFAVCSCICKLVHVSVHFLQTAYLYPSRSSKKLSREL